MEGAGPAPSRGLSAALSELYARAPRGMTLGLGAMEGACQRFGHPERSFEAVHVAGTNGKGSTSAMVEAVARAGGARTGLYTSPHLHKFAERIRVGGAPIDDAHLDAVLTEVLAREPDLSFFEAATLAAFVAFRELRVELAVIEVGIGGRLDATNVLERPRAAAITRIAFDHQDKLGGTLVDIAREKAGIAKPGLTILLGPMSSEVEGAIAEAARAKGASTARAFDLTRDVALDADRVGLRGAHQVDNARMAWALGRHLGLDDGAIARGVAEVRWPGRLERLTTPEGPVLLDAAHNPDGALALANELATMRARGEAPPSERTALVFGALADKDWLGSLDPLAPFAGARVYVRPQGRAAADPADLARRHPGALAASPAEALAWARREVRDGLVVVTGSIFLVGELRGLLLGIAPDPVVAL